MRRATFAALALCACLAIPTMAEDPSAPTASAATEPEAAGGETTTTGAVARAQVTSAVVDREPTDAIDRVSGEVDSLAYFTELVGLEGQTVSHVWERQGVEMARISFEVGGARWRVHSTKRLDPSWVGAWRVVVVDAEGAELRSDHFYYASDDTAADPGAGETPPAAPAPE